ncbi:hypothetical protein B0I26_109122 [Anoxybacillus vitaminiphilus]|uniref:Uncharacterized protein n=1 Tax=Paranoxybacillus vitaminiphilus TaxID=581036 RepID=A0A327YDY7_9BACL|nr:hypothetical protein [Anoxybacillus vitaminiphilus]RAK18701.1 hypothetical protein B0I26_109122 [Anoxybacillus vitaminiphilus]
MNLMPVRLFTIEDGEGYVADVFQCPVTGNLIYKATGAPSVASYNHLTEQQKRELKKYGFKLFEQSPRRANFMSNDQSVEELLPDLK